jgi:hypothetical protein
VSAKLEHRWLHISAGTSSLESTLTGVHHRGPVVAKKQKLEGLCANVRETMNSGQGFFTGYLKDQGPFRNVDSAVAGMPTFCVNLGRLG